MPRPIEIVGFVVRLAEGARRATTQGPRVDPREVAKRIKQWLETKRPRPSW